VLCRLQHLRTGEQCEALVFISVLDGFSLCNLNLCCWKRAKRYTTLNVDLFVMSPCVEMLGGEWAPFSPQPCS
jgi:hypothetical protein